MDFDELKLGLLNDEIKWGLRYRGVSKGVPKPPVLPKMSPLNMQLLWQRYQITRKIHELEIIKRQLAAKSPPKHLRLKPPPGMKQVDRAALSRKQYINFLSTPVRHCCPYGGRVKDPLRELRKSLRHEPRCSPRLMELSRPTKNRVYNTWKDFQCLFPVEMIVRLKDLLQTDHTLDPAYARCCFKEFDRKKRKTKYEINKKHKKVKKQKKKENTHWLKTQIELTVNVIIDYFQQSGLLNLNYKQMLISNVIVNVLICHGCLRRKPMRCSCKPYEKAIIDVVDQLAVWMDTIIRYVDAQYPEYEESEPSIICMEEVGEEGGEDNLGLLLCRQRLAELARKIAELKTEKYDMTKYEDEGLLISDLIEEEEYAFSLAHMLEKLKCEDDPLTKLIQILSLSPPEFLRSLVDEESMPGITYGDILDRLKFLQDFREREEKEKRKNILEQTMVDWAKTNDPDKLNKDILTEIQNAAQIISECIRKEREAKGIKEDKSQMIEDEESKIVIESEPLSSILEKEVEDDSLKPILALETDESAAAEGSSAKAVLLDTDQDVSDISTSADIGEESKAIAEFEQAGQPEDEKVIEPIEDIFGIIPKHRPCKVFEHAPDTICCLTIKVWATWLLEVANNAQKWSDWLRNIIGEIKRIASIIRGEVVDEQGKMVMYYRDDWKEFVDKVGQMIISWHQYSTHVRDLTDKIINNFHGKRITCCPKCLEDNLIVNIAVAHDISQQLAEAMNTASYWRRWLDSIVQETQTLTHPTDFDICSERSSFAMEVVEVCTIQRMHSDESVYELVEL